MVTHPIFCRFANTKKLRSALPILCLFFGFFAFFLSVFRPSAPRNLERGRFLKRPFYGGDVSRYPVRVEGLSSVPLEIEIPVSPRTYGEEELEEACKACMDDLSLAILNGNASANEVYEDLSLPSFVEKYGLYVNWRSSDPELLTSYGNVRNDALEHPISLRLTADLHDADYAFHRTYEIPITVHPRRMTEEEKIKKNFLLFLSKVDLEQACAPHLELPSAFHGMPITYKERSKDRPLLFPVFGILAAVFLVLHEKQTKEKHEKTLRRQMLLDYPELLSKLMIFVGAGMTIRLALENIAQDYENDCLQNKTAPETHAAYEMLSQAVSKLKTGANEGNVYREFGRACKLRQYMKLAGILEQNRKKGLSDIRAIFSAEMQQAWEERKNLARRLGEEAGTKLLAPLFIMLIVVMVMIVVPAMLSF